MTTKINPLYNQYFPVNGLAPNDWKPFKNYQALQGNEPSIPDFSISSEKTWIDTAKTISLILLKIIIFPWGLYEVTKALIGRIVMLLVYPAQVIFTAREMDRLRQRVEATLEQNRDFVGREVVLEKNGLRYTGLLFGHQSDISNGKWALYATGNSSTIEHIFLENGEVPYSRAGFNILLVNGPGVGRSEGLATAERIGDAQEVAISFLETAIKAKKIVLAGHSLGGAAIGKAALQHTFLPDVHYLAMRMMTFARLSQIAAKFEGSLAGKVITWFGSEMDSVAASKKFQEQGIHEIVIQGGQDEMMAQVDLLEALQKEDLMENKTGLLLPNAGHGDLPSGKITEEIQKWDRSLEPALAV